jgi:hypothetical protein
MAVLLFVYPLQRVQRKQENEAWEYGENFTPDEMALQTFSPPTFISPAPKGSVKKNFELGFWILWFIGWCHRTRRQKIDSLRAEEESLYSSQGR